MNIIVCLLFAYQQTGSVMTVRAVRLVLIIDNSDIVDLTAMCFMCFCGPFVKKPHSCFKHELLLCTDITSVAAAAKVVMGYWLN